MSIVKMKRLRLCVVSSQREEVLRELMLLRCVQVSEPEAAQEDAPLLRRNEPEDLPALRTEHAQMVNAVTLLKRYAPEKSKLLAPMPEVSADRLLDETDVARCLGAAGKITELDDRIRRLTAEESAKRGEIEALLPWKELDLPLDCAGTATSTVTLGVFPGSASLDEIEAALSDATELCQLYRVHSQKDAHYAAIVCWRGELDAVQTALRPYGFTAVSFGDAKGTAADNIAAKEKRLNEIAEEKTRCAEEIVSFAEMRQELKLRADTLATKVSRAEAGAKMLCTDSVSVIDGWIPAEKVPELDALTEKYCLAYETRDPTEDEYPVVPVKLKNGRVSRALNTVTEMYSLPAYDGVDPNPLMTPFFILFYGIMMADMGYGILMVLATAIILKVKKPRNKHFFELFFWCGISTFIWGALTGGFFGDAPLQIAKIINPDTTWEGLPYLFSPLNDTVMILLGAMVLGVFHIITGTVVGFIENVKRRDWGAAVSDELCVWFILLGAVFLVLGWGPWVLIIGFLLMAAGSFMTHKGLGKITGIFGAVYNFATGYFGDILSYARLMALMLAGSVIAQVFNTIGAIPGNIFVFLLVSIVGNALNFGLNLLGCYVHDLRLQCLEFFGKFYKDGGKPFRPLNMDTKYVNVSEN